MSAASLRRILNGKMSLTNFLHMHALENEEENKRKVIKSLRDMRNNRHDYCINFFFVFGCVELQGKGIIQKLVR